MKTITTIIIGTSLFFYSNTNAQISGGAQLSYLKLFGGTGISSLGLGLKGEYAASEKVAYLGGFNYYFPENEKYTTIANASSSDLDPNHVDVDYEQKFNFIHIYVGAKYYFAGETAGSFGVYGLGEAGYLFAPFTTTVGDVPSGYHTSLEDGTENVGNLTINFGIGGEGNIGFGYLFGDVKLNLPANQANGVEVAINIPASASFNAGVRVPFGDTGSSSKRRSSSKKRRRR